MNGREKYLRTARLGEGVIFTVDSSTWCAAIIIAQHTQTKVDVMVIDPLGSMRVETNVEFDLMAEKPRSWANRPKM